MTDAERKWNKYDAGIRQVFTKDGYLLAEYDPCSDGPKVTATK